MATSQRRGMFRAGWSQGMRVDREIDFHGFTASRMLANLESIFARREWSGLKRVRVIHGTGEVLPFALRKWCDERGILWTLEERNPGVTILHPSRRQPLVPARPKRTGRLPEPHKKPADSAEGPPQEDLMEAEMQRLAREDPRSSLRRKYRGDE